MIRQLSTSFSHSKYRLAMFVLLAGATVFSVAVWRVRTEFSGSERYGFLLWNLFLAWIPFIISYFTFTLSLQRKWVYLFIPVAAFSLADLLSQCAVHPDRFSTPGAFFQ